MMPLAKNVLNSRLVAALASPLSVDDYLGLIDKSLSTHEPRGRVVSVARQRPDSVTLEIAPNDNWAGHRPGQHVPLGVEIEGIRPSRCFSLTSVPGEPLLEITVKRNGQGRASNYLVDHAERGLLVYLSPAAGNFSPCTHAPPRALLLSAGSGITPVMGLLRQWLARRACRDIVFVHYARRRADMLYATELDALAERHPALRVVTVFTADAHGQRISAERLKADVPDFARRQTWLCGPAGFMDTAEPLVRAASSQPLHREHFAATRRDAARGAGDVCFTRSGRAASGDNATLLEVAEGAGLQPAYGCRMGICHACACRVQHGRVRDLRTNRVRDVRHSDIQLCIHAAAGEVAVEL